MFSYLWYFEGQFTTLKPINRFRYVPTTSTALSLAHGRGLPQVENHKWPLLSYVVIAVSYLNTIIYILTSC